MNQLFSIGKSLFKGASKNDDGNNGLFGDLLNPMTVFKQFDQNGDGKITEDDFIVGKYIVEAWIIKKRFSSSKRNYVNQGIEQIGLGVVGEVAARGVFHKLDRNRNGKLDLSEALSAVEAIKELISGSRGGASGRQQPSDEDHYQEGGDEEHDAHYEDEEDPHQEGEHGEDEEHEEHDEEHHEEE